MGWNFQTTDGSVKVLSGTSAQTTVLFTSSGTFSKASYPWAKVAQVRVVGGGGGSGGCANQTSNPAHSAGGGGGGYSEKTIYLSEMSDSEAVTIGAGGTAGGSVVAGGTGGTSSFGAHCSATGGAGGVSAFDGTANHFDGGDGGVGSGGDVNLRGSEGGPGINTVSVPLGYGGASGGGMGPGICRSSTNSPVAGKLYGGGAKGRYVSTGNGGLGGAAGAAGVVIINLYG